MACLIIFIATFYLKVLCVYTMTSKFCFYGITVCLSISCTYLFSLLLFILFCFILTCLFSFSLFYFYSLDICFLSKYRRGMYLERIWMGCELGGIGRKKILIRYIIWTLFIFKNESNICLLNYHIIEISSKEFC